MPRRRRPPKAPLALRVGIVGHRPDRLEHADLRALGTRIRSLLRLIHQEVRRFPGSHPDVYADGDPTLRAVSSLAEGTDRIFASEALELGYELCCPMPFAQSEFEQDFFSPRALEKDSLLTFRTLLDCAERKGVLTKFQMDGTRAEEDRSYAAAGRLVINQSDLLFAVWDGERRGAVGGTETTFEEARRRGVPIVWIDAHAPHAWQLVDDNTGFSGNQRAVPSGKDVTKRLAKLVRELLDLPTVESARARSSLHAFYSETQPVASPEFVWKIFRVLFGGAPWRMPAVRVADFESNVPKDWPSELQRSYAWTDQLAVYYSNGYRSAFLLAYGLAAVAVGLALVPVAKGWSGDSAHFKQMLVAGGEIVSILVILGLIIRGRTRHWHRRWIDYRLGSELLRHLRIAYALGGERPFPQLAAHFAKYGQPGATWAAWYVRAIERHLGLPNVTVDQAYLGNVVETLNAWLREQCDYHGSNGRYCRAIGRRLHLLGTAFLAATLVAGVMHVAGGVVPWFPHPLWLPGVLVACSAFFPALGASLAGINNQGEFRRITKRSEAMVDHLTHLIHETERIRSLRWSAVVDLATKATQPMVNEVLDWRVVFLDRPLDPPS